MRRSTSGGRSSAFTITRGLARSVPLSERRSRRSSRSTLDRSAECVPAGGSRMRYPPAALLSIIRNAAGTGTSAYSVRNAKSSPVGQATERRCRPGHAPQDRSAPAFDARGARDDAGERCGPGLHRGVHQHGRERTRAPVDEEPAPHRAPPPCLDPADASRRSLATPSCSLGRDRDVTTEGSRIVMSANETMSYLDRSVRPCEDFFRYANGGWIARAEIPPEEPAWGAFYEIRDRNLEILHEICEE